MNAVKSNNLKLLHPIIYSDDSYKETASPILWMVLCEYIEPIH